MSTNFKPTNESVQSLNFIWDTGTLQWLPETQPGGGGGGGAVTIADGADSAEGSTGDAAWSGSGAGTVIAILKKMAGSGIGGGPATIADGADVTQGAIADAAVIGDNSGTISAKLRGINKALAGTIKVDPSGVTSPVSLASIPNPSNLDVALSTRLKPADTLAAVTTVGTITNPVSVSSISGTVNTEILGTPVTASGFNSGSTMQVPVHAGARTVVFEITGVGGTNPTGNLFIDFSTDGGVTYNGSGLNDGGKADFESFGYSANGQFATTATAYRGKGQFFPTFGESTYKIYVTRISAQIDHIQLRGSGLSAGSFNVYAYNTSFVPNKTDFTVASSNDNTGWGGAYNVVGVVQNGSSLPTPLVSLTNPSAQMASIGNFLPVAAQVLATTGGGASTIGIGDTVGNVAKINNTTPSSGDYGLEVRNFSDVTAGTTTAPAQVTIVGGKTADVTPAYDPIPLIAGGSAVSTSDTHFPASAALADSTTNPTVTGIGSYLMGYNFGSGKWDRVISTNGQLAVAVESLPTVTSNNTITGQGFNAFNLMTNFSSTGTAGQTACNGFDAVMFRIAATGSGSATLNFQIATDGSNFTNAVFQSFDISTSLGTTLTVNAGTTKNYYVYLGGGVQSLQFNVLTNTGVTLNSTGYFVPIASSTLQLVNQGTSPWVENVSQFGGSNVVTGTGASGVGIPRVTVSSDSFPATQVVSGTVTANQGASPFVTSDPNALSIYNYQLREQKYILSQILLELKVLNWNLHEGLNVKDDMDELRNDLSFESIFITQ